MLDVVIISAGDQDVAVRTTREIIPKIGSCIIRVIKQEQPLLALPSKPIECIFRGFAYGFGESDGSEVRVCCFGRTGVNEIYIREPEHVEQSKENSKRG